MREIKFRAWDKIAEWMCDNFSDETIEIDVNTLRAYSGDWEIMQFTGLKDKNEKEIFEGDIVKTKNMKGIKKSSKGVWKVVWNKYATGFEGELISKEEDDTGEEFECLGNFRDYNVEVIGNIYENPKLLDVKGGSDE